MPILEIENIEIDLGESPISLNKSAYSIRDWFVRILDSSDRVSLPESKILRDILKRPSQPEIVANKFGRYYSFKYKDFGTVLFAGNAILLNSNQDIEIQLMDQAKEFFDNLNQSIRNLDFEADDFVFSVAEYDLKKIDNDSVWIWPAVAMHENRNVNNTILAGGAPDAKLKYSRPMFSIFKLNQKILSTNKWNVNRSPLLDIADSLCISSNAQRFFVTSYQKTLSQIIVSGGAITGLDTNDFNFGLTVSPTSLNIGAITNIFRLRGSITATSESLFIINGLSSPGGTDAQKQEFVINKGTNNYDFISNEFKTTEITNNIDFSIVSAGTVTFNDTLLYTIIEEQNLGALSGNNLIGYLVKVYDNLPDISQIDFLKNQLSMFGAFIQSSGFKKQLNVNSYRILSKNNSIDWSDKFIQDSEIVSGVIGSYGRLNYFAYDNDDTIPAATGRGMFSVDNETLKDIATVFTNIFGASNDVEIDSLDMADFNIYDNTERINEINDRILFYQLDGGLGITHATFSQISGDKVLEIYHKNITESLFNTTVIECSVNLNRTDFFTFDFRRPVYIKYFKSNFLVLDINEYIEGQTSKVTLLKYK